MILKARLAQLENIQSLRTRFLQETNVQIRYDACHRRNWSDSYHLMLDDQIVGYGSIKGKEDLADRDAVFEFYVLPPYRKWNSVLFQELLQTSGAAFVESQTNEPQLTGLLYEFCKQVYSEVILFADHVATHYHFPELLFRRREEPDVIFGKKANDLGDFVVEKDGDILAVGGFLTHYNPPFADLHMEVRSDCRNQGIGSFLLQEIKKACYLAGRVPAARCNMSNKASRACLIKAGLQVCGFMLCGKVQLPIK